MESEWSTVGLTLTAADAEPETARNQPPAANAGAYTLQPAGAANAGPFLV